MQKTYNVSERYEAKRIHRFALGGGYRDLWKAKIELPVLDLATEGGGHGFGYYGVMAEKAIGFIVNALDQERLRIR